MDDTGQMEEELYDTDMEDGGLRCEEHSVCPCKCRCHTVHGGGEDSITCTCAKFEAPTDLASLMIQINHIKDLSYPEHACAFHFTLSYLADMIEDPLLVVLLPRIVPHMTVIACRILLESQSPRAFEVGVDFLLIVGDALDVAMEVPVFPWNNIRGELTVALERLVATVDIVWGGCPDRDTAMSIITPVAILASLLDYVPLHIIDNYTRWTKRMVYIYTDAHAKRWDIRFKSSYFLVKLVNAVMRTHALTDETKAVIIKDREAARKWVEFHRAIGDGFQGWAV